MPNVAVGGGTIDATAIGSTTASAGKITTLSASSTSTHTGVATFTAAPVLSSTTASTILGVNASKSLGSVTLTGGLTAGALTLTITPSGIQPPPATKTGAYTIAGTDNAGTLLCNSASTFAVTFPVLTAGVRITIIQSGAVDHMDCKLDYNYNCCNIRHRNSGRILGDDCLLYGHKHSDNVGRHQLRRLGYARGLVLLQHIH